jgi:hypothetical protein
MEHHNYIPSISVEYNSQHGGSKFNLNKKRYKQYDIKKYINKINQNGGDINITSDDYQQLSNFSEFDKIREYMISQMKSEESLSSNNQKGGFRENYLNINPNSPSPATPMEKPFNFFKLMKGGTKDSDSESYDNDNYGDDNNFLNTESSFDSFSETSIDNKQSDVNILPFYSSDSSSDYNFQHPYARNRFN